MHAMRSSDLWIFFSFEYKIHTQPQKRRERNRRANRTLDALGSFITSRLMINPQFPTIHLATKVNNGPEKEVTYNQGHSHMTGHLATGMNSWRLHCPGVMWLPSAAFLADFCQTKSMGGSSDSLKNHAIKPGATHLKTPCLATKILIPTCVRKLRSTCTFLDTCSIVPVVWP